MKEKFIVKKVVDFIEKNIEKDLSLEEIACHFNYSKFYISRLFAKEFDCTIYKYIKMRRLTEAAKKIVETKKPLIEIAFEANYNSQQAFMLAFKQEFYYTPYMYRKRGIFIPKQPKLIMNLYMYSYKNICSQGLLMTA